MKAVDIFAGAGGFSDGAERVGIKVVAAANHWPLAVESHQANHPEAVHFCQDVMLLDPTRLPPHDMMLAAPACQGHSRARGTDKPHHDRDRSTAWCVVNIAEVCRPSFVVVENVPDFRLWPLLTHWLGAMHELGYKSLAEILNAADFGARTDRKRIFIRFQLGKHPTPIRPPRRSKRLGFAECIDWSAGGWSPVTHRRFGEETLKPRAASVLERIEASRRELGDRFILPYFSGSRIGRSLDRPLGTLTTRDRYALVDGDRMRMITVLEAKRAMSFRDSYYLAGGHREQMHQVGNAVSPIKAAEILRQTVGG